MRVLLRAPNWIGDAVMALPAVAALGERPDVRLTVAAPPAVHPVYAGLPGVALSPIDPRVPTAARVWPVARALASDDDIAVLLPRSFSSALVARLAGIPRRVGRRGDGRDVLLTDPLPVPPAPTGPIRGPVRYEPAFHRWRDYAGVVEHVLGEPVRERYPLAVPDAAGGVACQLLREPAGAGPTIALHPAANGPARRWPIERYEALGRRLRAELDARLVVVGGSAAAGLCARVAGAVPGAVSLAGRTGLKTLMALLARVALFITNDTGPVHLAAALGTPLLDLCGAADERVTGPRGPAVRVLRETLWCSPCVRNACPFDLECMLALDVARVADEAAELLQRGRAA